MSFLRIQICGNLPLSSAKDIKFIILMVFVTTSLKMSKKIIIFNKEMYKILISPMKTMPHYCILLFTFPVQRAKYET